MCDIWKRKDGRALTLVDLSAHRESLLSLGVKQVVLTGGEPLLNRDLESIAKFCRSVGARVTLLTTGLLLATNVNMIAECVDEIIVSIDGPEDVHDFIRQVPNGFRRISAGMQRLRDRTPLLPIACRTTVQKLNHAHLSDTVVAAKLIGMKSISFLPADLSSAAFNREQHWDPIRQNAVALTLDEVKRLELELERLIEEHAPDIQSGFILEGATKLRSIATRFRGHLEGTTPRSPLCNAPWKSAVIEVNGDLRPCFFHAPVANIAQQPLMAAINSHPAMNFRDSLDVAANPTCQRGVCSLNLRG